MSTYKATFKTYQNGSNSIHFKQNDCQTIVKSTNLLTCNYPEAQTGLYMDVSIRQSSKDNTNWPSFEYTLKQLFQKVMDLQKYPNSMVRIYIFVLQNGREVKSAIINGLWILLLRMGVSMKKSIFCREVSSQNNLIEEDNKEAIYKSKTSQQRNVYNLHDLDSIIQGETHLGHFVQNASQRQSLVEQAQKYRQFVDQVLRQSLYL